MTAYGAQAIHYLTSGRISEAGHHRTQLIQGINRRLSDPVDRFAGATIFAVVSLIEMKIGLASKRSGVSP